MDALVRRSPKGLPIVPGRQLKGRLRAVCRMATRIPHLEIASSDVVRWFGTELPKPASGEERDFVDLLEETRFRTQPGELTVHDALVGRGADAARWEAWAGINPDQLHLLFHAVSATAVGVAGVAREKSLRSTEVTVPLSLWASIEGPTRALDTIELVLPLFREIGAHGTRGLGRVEVSLEVQP